MHLNSAIFEQITGIRGFRVGSYSRERRQAGRVAFSAHIVIARLTGGHIGMPHRTRSRDISLSGIGLLYSEPMCPGEQFLLQLPAQKREPIWLLCEVARCRPAGENLFIVGATFKEFVFPQDAANAVVSDAAANASEPASVSV